MISKTENNHQILTDSTHFSSVENVQMRIGYSAGKVIFIYVSAYLIEFTSLLKFEDYESMCEFDFRCFLFCKAHVFPQTESVLTFDVILFPGLDATVCVFYVMCKGSIVDLSEFVHCDNQVFAEIIACFIVRIE